MPRTRQRHTVVKFRTRRANRPRRSGGGPVAAWALWRNCGAYTWPVHTGSAEIRPTWRLDTEMTISRSRSSISLQVCACRFVEQGIELIADAGEFEPDGHLVEPIRRYADCHRRLVVWLVGALAGTTAVSLCAAKLA